MPTLFVTIRAKPGCEAELRAGVRTLVAATREEPGCVEYGAYVSEGDPAAVRFFEVWRDEAARDAHVLTPHFQTFFALSKGLLGRRPEIDEVAAL